MKQSDHQKTVCLCNHLTNFAILMRPYSPVRFFVSLMIVKLSIKKPAKYITKLCLIDVKEAEDEQSLKTMSLVGVILSVTFTAITLLIYILTWK